MLLRRIKNKLIRKRGYNQYFVPRVSNYLKENLKYKKMSLKDKIKWIKRGFLAYEVDIYKLNDENYKNYISDLEYLKLYPINNDSKWIDDKLTTKYVLHEFSECMPEYYYQIYKKSKIFALMDLPSGYEEKVEDIVKLLKEKQELAFKLMEGSLGKGFYKVSYGIGKIYVNNKEFSENEFIEFLNNIEGYIITEYLKPHKDLAKIYSETPNTIRVMVINEDNKPYIPNAFIRFGNSKAGLIDNACSGGMFAIIDVKTGRFSDAKILKNGQICNVEKHFDTGTKIEGIIPLWDEIKSELIAIAKYVPQLTYMGIDVVVTEDGFKILEINSHQDVKFYQYYYPLLKDNQATEFFKGKLKERGIRK